MMHHANSPYYAKGSVSGEAIEDDGEDEEIEFDENDVKPAEIVRSKEGELTELNAEDTRNMLLYIADKIIANKPYLTEIDSAIGDGDHGIGMAGGMQKAKKKLLKMAGEENAYQLFETAGQAMLMSMGGASGVIFGSLYLAGAKGMDPKICYYIQRACRYGEEEPGGNSGKRRSTGRRQDYGRCSFTSSRCTCSKC